MGIRTTLPVIGYGCVVICSVLPSITDLPCERSRKAYATQMPGTATFWNRCGEATAEVG